MQAEVVIFLTGCVQLPCVEPYGSLCSLCLKCDFITVCITEVPESVSHVFTWLPIYFSTEGFEFSTGNSHAHEALTWL